jgi:hypothetical protein
VRAYLTLSAEGNQVTKAVKTDDLAFGTVSRHRAEADPPLLLGPELDVGDPPGRHQHPATALIDQAEQAVVTFECLAQGDLDLVRTLSALEHDLSWSVLDADLDLHVPILISYVLT